MSIMQRGVKRFPKENYETNNDVYAMAGNAPILVENATGKLFETGTAYSVEHYISQYEKYGDPNR